MATLLVGIEIQNTRCYFKRETWKTGWSLAFGVVEDNTLLFPAAQEFGKVYKTEEKILVLSSSDLKL